MRSAWILQSKEVLSEIGGIFTLKGGTSAAEGSAKGFPQQKRCFHSAPTWLWRRFNVTPQCTAVATCRGVAPPTNQNPQTAVAQLAVKKSDWPTLDVIQGLSNYFLHFIFYF